MKSEHMSIRMMHLGQHQGARCEEQFHFVPTHQGNAAKKRGLKHWGAFAAFKHESAMLETLLAV